MNKKKLILILSIFVISGVGLSSVMIKATSSPDFCGSCHEMKPMYDSWARGPHAFAASCSDCHLPHDSTISYLSFKAKSGIKDVYSHFFNGKIDNFNYWFNKRNQRQQFVFVSNCIRCHTPLPDNKFHREFLSGRIEGNCLTCHWYVGHGKDFVNNLYEFWEGQK